MNTDPKNDWPAEDDPAIDGLIKEYARTGRPGDDEQLVKSVLDRIENVEPEKVTKAKKPKVLEGRPERDWPWLFGKRFWKLTTALALVCTLGIGGNAWFIARAQADPTEVMLFTRPRFAPGDDARLRVLVRDGRDKTAIANARVDVVLSGNGVSQEIPQAKTDEDGVVDITAELDQQLSDGDYTFQVKVSASTGRAAAEQTIAVTRSYRTMVSTDKPMYQPGQIIHMRALSLNVDSMTPAGQRAVEFIVRDGKGNKVFAARPRTSDFGIAAADFKLANQVNEGDYQIAVTVGDTTSERTVKVQRYVLPKFRIDMKTDRSYYQAGDELTVTLDADYLFGKPTAGADVRIEAADMTAGRNVFQTVTGTTNADGRFEAKVKLPGRMAGTRANAGDAEVFFAASVTDKSGETNSTTVSRIVANTPLRIEVFPESGELVPGVENTLYIMTALPDGTPVQTTVTTLAGTEITTNEVGIGKVKLTPQNDGLKLSITARDEATGVTAAAVKELRVGQQANDVLLRTDRAVYRQGETANLTVLSGSPGKRAFVDVIREGRSLATSVIDLTNQKGEYALDLPPDVLGTVQIQAYCIQPSGRIARDTKVVQVQRADQLKVTATLDAESYKPAQQAMVNFLVQSKNGDPVQAALSLAIVDEAVFALNDSRPGLEEMYFLIQEELLKPRYQFITQPGRNFTRDGGDVRPELREAQVVRFSAAEATDGSEPESVSGESLSQRIIAVEKRQTDNMNERLMLMGSVPFFLFLFLASIFLIYVLTRLFHRGQNVSPSVAGQFRGEMRLLFWTSIVSMIAIPVTLFFATQAGRNSNTIGSYIVLGVVGIACSILIGQPAFRIRRLLARHDFANLFSRLVLVIPGLYAMGVVMFVGYAIAGNISDGARPNDFGPTRMLPCVLGMATCVGSLGFLRRTLTEPRSLGQNLLSAGIHQGLAVVIPVVAVFLVSQVGVKSLATSATPIDLIGGTMEKFTEQAYMDDSDVSVLWDSGSLPADSGSEGKDQSEPRVRRFFPETLLWQPQLLTDESGQAKLNVQLADSITTWRLAGSAVTRDGRLGSFQQGIRVFQDFFIDIQMPVQLTQNDEISIPVGIFNYLNDPQTISLEATEADWFELLDGEPTKTVEAAANEVLQTSYRIRVIKPGRHALTVKAKGTVLADAIERTVRVEPDGVRREVVVNAKLNGEASQTITIPDDAIAGGNDLFVKLYPGGFSQVVEGMDSIFQMPHGCFEQTSSTTYPNVLVLNYLRETKQVNPEIELKALDYIATGYQRLLSFEVDGGGFDWFGSPPANEVLTAYGLHEFIDMAKVYEVDTEMIQRTRSWLLSRMQSNGTWSGEDLRHESTNDSSTDDRTIRQTAYVTWALARSGDLDRLGSSIAFLEANSDSKDPYVLALVANALHACGRTARSLDIVARLSDMAQENGETAFWTSQDSGLTYGSGDSLAIETTALVAQAMIATGRHPALVVKALDWIVSKRDGRGTWHSTQATVQAMRTLLLAGEIGTIEKDTTIQITVNGKAAAPLVITEETGDVFHLVSLSEFVQDGENTVSMTIDTDSIPGYQLVAVHYEPRSDEPETAEKVLQIATNYGKRKLDVDDLLTVDVILRYNRAENAPMTLVDLGIPPGFAIETESFRELVQSDVITKFEAKGQQVSLYFSSIPGNGKPTKFAYKLRAKYPVKAKAPGNVAYQYYEPEIRDQSPAELLTIQ